MPRFLWGMSGNGQAHVGDRALLRAARECRGPDGAMDCFAGGFRVRAAPEARARREGAARRIQQALRAILAGFRSQCIVGPGEKPRRDPGRSRPARVRLGPRLPREVSAAATARAAPSRVGAHDARLCIPGACCREMRSKYTLVRRYIHPYTIHAHAHRHATKCSTYPPDADRENQDQAALTGTGFDATGNADAQAQRVVGRDALPQPRRRVPHRGVRRTPRGQANYTIVEESIV